MKYLLMSLIFFYNLFPIFSQVELVNKTLTTQIEIIPQFEPNSNTVSKNGLTYTQNMGTQQRSTTREVKVKKKSDDLLQVNRVIKQVKIKIKTKTEEKTYDSENTFDRDQTTQLLGKKYDIYINAPEESIFNLRTNSLESTYQNTMFQNIWEETVRLHPIDEWDYLLLNKSTFSLNESWTDTIKTSKKIFINRYKCTKLDNNQALITLKGQIYRNNTNQTKDVGEINITTSTNSENYEGELSVDTNTKLITEINLIKTIQQTSSTMGMDLKTEKSTKIYVKNKIK